jgi:tripartite-type tricarboxylate transporter receptor subunit TctC
MAVPNGCNQKTLLEETMIKLAPKLCMIALAAVHFVFANAAPAAAQDYPNRPVRVIIAVTPGGVADIFMRALGERLTAILKQPFIMENRPGGTFNIATRNCAEATPDGYTICLLPGEPLTYNQFLFKNPGFNTATDFATITNLFFITQVLAVNTALGVRDFGELAKLSKDKPGTLSYTAPSLSHATFIEGFKKRTGADIVGVPFKGGGDAMANFLSGSVPVVFLGLGNVLPYIEPGKAQVLASDGDKRSPIIPNVPTVQEIFKDISASSHRPRRRRKQSRRFIARSPRSTRTTISSISNSSPGDWTLRSVRRRSMPISSSRTGRSPRGSSRRPAASRSDASAAGAGTV